jgi:Lipocalin-like domain
MKDLIRPLSFPKVKLGGYSMNQLAKLFVCSSIGLASVALNGSTVAVAGELVGTWNVQSLMHEEFSDGKMTKKSLVPMRGEIVFTSDGHYLVAIFAQQRALSTDENQATLGQDMIVHAGQYRVSGEKLFQNVYVALSDALIGVTQMQFISWAGDQLVLENMPTQNGVEGKAGILTLTLERQQ